MWCLVLFGSVKLCEGHRHRVLRKICGPKREEVAGDGENCMMRVFVILAAH